jgi:hypothetical protein
MNYMDLKVQVTVCPICLKPTHLYESTNCYGFDIYCDDWHEEDNTHTFSISTQADNITINWTADNSSNVIVSNDNSQIIRALFSGTENLEGKEFAFKFSYNYKRLQLLK